MTKHTVGEWLTPVKVTTKTNGNEILAEANAVVDEAWAKAPVELAIA